MLGEGVLRSGAELSVFVLSLTSLHAQNTFFHFFFFFQKLTSRHFYVQVTVHRDKLRIKQPTRCSKYPTFILS